jgi:hypothetical protein
MVFVRNVLAVALFLTALVGVQVPSQAYLSCLEAQDQCENYFFGQYSTQGFLDECTHIFQCCTFEGCYGPQYCNIC